MRVQESQLRDVVARSEISNLMARYVQGVDHLDADLLKSCYHSDAFEMHHVFNGNAHAFADWRIRQTFSSHHMLSACAITLDGDRAYVETPHTSLLHVELDEPDYKGIIELKGYGWYLDLFGKRGGLWRIDFQRVVSHWSSMRLLPGSPARAGESAAPTPEVSWSSMRLPSADAAEQHDQDIPEVNPFRLGFALASDKPEESQIEDVSAGIRAAYLSQLNSPG